jgi:phage baseplate assembly protein W
MSKDALLSHACPHHIRFERVEILGGREIIPKSPISSSGLLEIRFDGVVVDKEGLYYPSDVVFPFSAPYRFSNGNNTLIVQSDSTVQNIPLPENQILSQKEIIDILNENISELTVASSFHSSVKISNELKSNNLILSGTAMVKLGFSTNKIVVRNKKRYSDWVLVKQLRGGFKVMFREEVDFNGLVDISYLTTKEYCRRCNGTGVENDFRYTEQGDIKTIGDFDLLYQNVAKILLTEIGTNPYHVWYGSTAIRLVGKKVSASVVHSLRASVRDALSNFKNVQDQQAGIQEMSFKERLSRVKSIDVSTIGADETSYLVSVVIESMSAEAVSINIIFAVPGSIPLDGDLS